jgi:hypothetical protein
MKMNFIIGCILQMMMTVKPPAKYELLTVRLFKEAIREAEGNEGDRLFSILRRKRPAKLGAAASWSHS